MIEITSAIAAGVIVGWAAWERHERRKAFDRLMEDIDRVIRGVEMIRDFIVGLFFLGMAGAGLLFFWLAGTDGAVAGGHAIVSGIKLFGWLIIGLATVGWFSYRRNIQRLREEDEIRALQLRELRRRNQ